MKSPRRRPRLLACAALAALLLAGGHRPAVAGAPDDGGALWAKASPALIRVERQTAQGSEVSTGFLIRDDGTFVSVISGVKAAGESGAATVTCRRGDAAFPARILAIDPQTLLAVGRADGLAGTAPIPLGESWAADAGAFAHAAIPSAGDGDPGRCTPGRIAGREHEFRSAPLPASVLRLHMAVPPGGGAFGAPILDRTGAAIGILLVSIKAEPAAGSGAGPQGGPDLAFALPAEIAQKILRDYEKLGAVRYPWLGFELDAGTTTPAIIAVKEGSPAAAAGLRTGDVIKSIAGRAVRSYQDVVDACYYLTPGDPAPIALLRGLEDAEASITPAEQTVLARPKPIEGHNPDPAPPPPNPNDVE
ncbi:MAG: S1C family serine protease [Verrucomicrobiales bacterium]